MNRDHSVDLFGETPGMARHKVFQYASGVDCPAVMTGYARAGHPMCLVANACTTRLFGIAKEFLLADGRLLLDSGAFGCRDTPARMRWDRVFEIYEQLARIAPQRVSLVLPDVVGDQHATLHLAAAYSEAIRALAATGAELLVPMQRGDLKFDDFFIAYTDAAGVRPTGLALPWNAHALTMVDLKAILSCDFLPRRLHFLGIGRDANGFVEPSFEVVCRWPTAVISCDSTLHRAEIGRGRSLRPITRDRDAALAGHLEEWRDRYDETEDDDGNDAIRREFASRFPNLSDEELDDLMCSSWGAGATWDHAIGTEETRVGPVATAEAIEQFARRRLAA